MFHKLVSLLFPPKCNFCRCVLTHEETDLCHHCRSHAPEFHSEKTRLKHIADWTAVWYYKGDVSRSIRRYKFWNARSYADFYGRMLALKLQNSVFLEDVDIITWAPVSRIRRMERGYDQSYLITRVLGQELGVKPVLATLRRKHTKPLSSLGSRKHRKTAISGAYSCPHPDEIIGKNILVVDDILTTGATAEEIANTLKAAGAGKIYFAVVATVQDNTKSK